jgi:hypothetical protein
MEAICMAVILTNTTRTSAPRNNNLIPVASTASKTEPTPLLTRIPITALTGKDPQHDKILPLGASVYYYLNRLHAPKHKLASRATVRRLILSNSPTNHRVWNPQTDAITTTADITPTDLVERIDHEETDSSHVVQNGT